MMKGKAGESIEAPVQCVSKLARAVAIQESLTEIDDQQ